MKPVNVSTGHEYQRWGRRALPSNLIVQDLDSWAILHSDAESHAPVVLIELKRSSIPVQEWEPFDADRRNYAALLDLANRAGIPLLVLYYVKGREIEDTTPLKVYHLTEAVPEYHGTRRIMSAAAFAASFPYPLSSLRPPV